VGVAGQVVENMLGATEGWLDVNVHCDGSHRSGRGRDIPVVMATFRSLSVVDERFSDYA
jgi:hypothetical protein